jgi:hypothetical protein
VCVGRLVRHLTRSGTPAVPKGLAFAIADLLLARSWAADNDIQTLVRLDHGAEDEEYEEVVEFQIASNPLSRLIMWRNAEAVFVQPIVGRARRYASVAAALVSLPAKPRTTMTKAAMAIVAMLSRIE